MTVYLTDTLLWTGALIALVLLLRRPVSRHLGAGAAYSLWLLPMGRLMMPPLVLPAWLAPVEADPVASQAFAAPDAVPMIVPAAPVTGVSTMPSIDWQPALLAFWLIGAAVFLVRRYVLYFRMRRDLLSGAKPVGEAGGVRLVESPAAEGPVAFGVIDKVVALPMGFMATGDRAARDLALAHELAHHRGRDLLANMLVQPLFALHWFNPLGIYGWQALRRDQEAACDARVIAGAPRAARAAYAEVIAHFARGATTQGRLALAAPMACPVLGDRSIVHRLRTLSMTDPTKRRRWTGRLLLAGSALALPLTASITYAHDPMPAPPPVAPVAPVAPAAPAAPHAPEPPAPPAPPAPPEAAADAHHVVVERVVDQDGKERVTKHKYVFHDRKALTEEERQEVEDRLAEARDRIAEARDRAAEARDRAAEAHDRRVESQEMQKEIHLAIAEARASVPTVKVECRNGQREVAETVTDAKGREQVFICQAAALGEARRGLAEARREVSRDRDMTAQERAEALRAIDAAMKGLGEG